MFVLIAVAGPSWLICSAKFLSLYLLGTILKYCFLTFDMLTPLIILATSADGIFQYLIRYNYKNNSTLLENLQILQNKAAKIILDRHPQSSASEALDSLGWKSLHLRRRFHRCTTIFKCLNGFIDFTFVEITQFTIKIRVPTTNVVTTNSGKQRFMYQSVVDWNSLSQDIRDTSIFFSQTCILKFLKSFK